MPNGTKYGSASVETEILLAAMNRDGEYIQSLAEHMTSSEIVNLMDAAWLIERALGYVKWLRDMTKGAQNAG